MVWGSYGGRKYKKNIWRRDIYMGAMKNPGEWETKVENMARSRKMSFSQFVVACINFTMEKLEKDADEERLRLEAKALANKVAKL